MCFYLINLQTFSQKNLKLKFSKDLWTHKHKDNLVKATFKKINFGMIVCFIFMNNGICIDSGWEMYNIIKHQTSFHNSTILNLLSWNISIWKVWSEMKLDIYVFDVILDFWIIFDNDISIICPMRLFHWPHFMVHDGFRCVRLFVLNVSKIYLPYQPKISWFWLWFQNSLILPDIWACVDHTYTTLK